MAAQAGGGSGGGDIHVTVNYPQLTADQDPRRVAYDIARELRRRQR